MPETATNRAPEKRNSDLHTQAQPVGLTWQHLLDITIGFARNHLGKGLLALAGLAGFLLTPAKDWAYHKIWREHAVLQCHVVPQQIFVDDDFELDLTVVPARITVSSGVIEVQYSSEKVNLVRPSGIIQTDPIGDTKVAAKLFFRAVEHGPADVNIHFGTKYGEYTVSQHVLVREADLNHIPSPANFTGTWNLRMGTFNGELHLQDDNGKIDAHYELENGDEGRITGVRGPAAIQASLMGKRGDHYSVECKVNFSDSFVELNCDFFDPRTPKSRQSFYGSSHL